MFAWVITDDGDGNEGVPSVWVDGMVYPLMGADLKNAKSMRPAAEDIAFRTGKQVRLYKFSQMEIIDVIDPPESVV
jgi:hypothetical protein